MKMIEIFDCGKLAVITEKTKLPKYALAKLGYSFGRGDKENFNKRTYPEDILIREINRKNEEIKKSKIVGQLEHPLSGQTKLDKAMHVISNLAYDRVSKLATAESLVLDTSGGRDFLTLLNSGVKMGVSMRGFGNIDKDGRVKTDYKLSTLDFVLKPAFGVDARIDQSNIIESANDLFNTGNHEHRKIEGLKKSARKKVEARDVFYEARMMGMTSKEYAEKINAGIAEEEATTTLDEKDRSILRDAKCAGLDTSTPESREKILTEWKQRESQIPKTKTFTEKAKILSEQTGTKIEVVVEMLEEEEEKKKTEKERVAELARINEQKHMAGANRPSLIKAPPKL